MIKQGDILVEDYPKFPAYDQIALITRSYNKDLEVPLRISSQKEFKEFLLNHL